MEMLAGHADEVAREPRRRPGVVSFSPRLTSGGGRGAVARVSWFITATDTGAGKTRVAKLLVEALRAAGHDAVGYKPVCCGERGDAEVLATASGGLPLDEVNPVWLAQPVAPWVATLLGGKVVEPRLLAEGYRKLAARHAMVVVEGVGGWEVPIAAGFSVADLAAELALPVVVVVANRLGAINHTLLTVKAVRARGLAVAGLVLNQLADELDTAMISNKAVLEDLTGVPVLEHLIHGQDFLDPGPFFRVRGAVGCD